MPVVSLGWIEQVELWGVFALVFVPSALACWLFGWLKSTRFTYLRLLAVAPLGLGFFVGLSGFLDLNRPGIREYLGVGIKKSALYGSTFVLPVVTLAALVVMESRVRTIEARSRRN